MSVFITKQWGYFERCRQSHPGLTSNMLIHVSTVFASDNDYQSSTVEKRINLVPSLQLK